MLPLTKCCSRCAVSGLQRSGRRAPVLPLGSRCTASGGFGRAGQQRATAAPCPASRKVQALVLAGLVQALCLHHAGLVLVALQLLALAVSW